MPTEASLRALDGLRDLSTVQWTAIPLLAFVFYIYTMEIRRARHSHDWDALIAGATLFGYFHFYVAVIAVLALKTMRQKLVAVGSLYTVGILANVVAMGLLGWVY